jgi:hypothetical protein
MQNDPHRRRVQADRAALRPSANGTSGNPWTPNRMRPTQQTLLARNFTRAIGKSVDRK